MQATGAICRILKCSPTVSIISYLTWDWGWNATNTALPPLADHAIKDHPDAAFLTHLKYACRNLIIDGPNCIIGCLPDTTMFMVQDRKKLRPGVIGGIDGTYVFASEMCGLDAVIPQRDPTRDFQPMHLDTAIVRPDRRGVELMRQTDPLLAN